MAGQTSAEPIVIDVDAYETPSPPPMVIDVDAFELPASPPQAPAAVHKDDDDIKFEGFRRTKLPAFKQKELDDDGLAYIGFNTDTARRLKRSAPGPQDGNNRTPTASSSRTTPSVEPIVISDDEDKSDTGPPAKKRKFTPSKPTSNAGVVETRPRRPGRSSAEAALGVPAVLHNSVARECARLLETDMDVDADEGQESDSEDDDFVTAGLYPWNGSEVQTNAHHVQVDEEQATSDLAIDMAALSVTEDFRKRPLRRIARLQDQHSGRMHTEIDRLAAYTTFEKCRSASWSVSAPSRPHRTAQSAFRPRSGHIAHMPAFCAFEATKVIYQAPGDVNTIVQVGRTVIVASAVADGAADDTPGDYNEKGSLSLWDGERSVIITGHGRKAARPAVHDQRHYFTVNDVASNPHIPARFVSAGRDNKILFWDSAAQNGLAEPARKLKFPNIPEVVKYQPGEINLAVQCNNGAVYIIRDGPGDAGPVRHLIVAQAQLKHVTADMHWGLGRTKNLLFASSACLADGTGYHRAFDVAKGRAVVNFDAEGQACSTLTTDPFGDNLYIATEGPDSRYTLRQYDVRDLARKTAKQHIDLEPFAGNPSRNDMDINCLSVSSDGIYIAAGRMDNRLDVYDARMLARGLLYNFAHEGGGPGTDSYGVVKVQWVDGVPYGTGFLSGGVDGCVRLWDMKLAGEDPRNGEVLARCDYDVATFTLGNMYEGEAPLVVGERSGKVTMFGYQKPDPWD